MRSEYLENFLRELKSTGKEKVEGYTLSNFDHMTKPEKELAFDLLRQELNHSSVAIDPMYYLNKEDACLIFKQKYIEQKNNGHVNFHLVAKIWNCEKSDTYAEAFEQCYDTLGEYSLIPYINDADTIDHPQSVIALAKIIIDSEKEYIRRYAAKTLIKKTEVLDDDRKNEIVNLAASENIQDRRKAIEQAKNHMS